MNREEWKKMFRRALPIFLGLAMAIAFYFLMLRFGMLRSFFGRVRVILMPFIYGGIMAYLLKAPCNFFDRVLEKHSPEGIRLHKTGLSVAIVLTIAFLVIYILLRTVVPEVTASIAMVTKAAPDAIQEFFDWLSEYLKSDGVVQSYVQPLVEDLSNQAVEWSNESVLPYLRSLMGNVSETITSIVNLVMDLSIGLIVCIYALCARKTFARQGKTVLYSLFPSDQAEHAVDEFRYVDCVFDGFISGKLLDSAAVGLICYAFCVIMSFARGMSNGILVSMIVGVMNLIPYFGPIIGAVIATLLVMISDPINGIIFLLFDLILMQVDGNILEPKLLAGSVGLSGFWVLFSITLFGGLFGFAGVLIGVPVFAVIYDAIRRLVRKGLARYGKEEMLPERAPLMSREERAEEKRERRQEKRVENRERRQERKTENQERRQERRTENQERRQERLEQKQENEERRQENRRQRQEQKQENRNQCQEQKQENRNNRRQKQENRNHRQQQKQENRNNRRQQKQQNRQSGDAGNSQRGQSRNTGNHG